MQVSHSRVECWNKCPYQYKLRYVDKLKTLPDFEADNALIIGTALHTGIEKDVKTAIDWYYSQYPIITDKHIEEAIKLEAIIPKCKAMLPDGIFEEKIENEAFIGFMDLLVPVEPGVFDLYDFKYSNNVKNYMESGQLHEYKYFFENITGNKIRKMYFLFAPKVAIRMKKTETLEQFRIRLKEELKDKEPQIVEVPYNPVKVAVFIADVADLETASEFEKSPSRLCDWCDYKDFCLEGDETMILPENKRKQNENANYKKIWFYGQPGNGKTFIADKFPNVLMLNTDGNADQYTAPVITIKDDIQTSERGGIKRTLAWKVFKDVILELEKKQNTFETIVVDLLEDCYEHCRRYIYQELDIKHESDSGFGKGYDIIRKEFLDTIKKLTNLEYNIILISHEDTSRDLTSKGGEKITSIKPNINEKIANKIAGMVKLVGRVMNDDGKRYISFKSNEVVFGLDRLGLGKSEIPNDYSTLIKLYEDAISNFSSEICQKVTENDSKVEEKPVVKENLTTEAEPEKLQRRQRKVEPVEEIETVIEEPVEQPTRRRRVRNTEGV